MSEPTSTPAQRRARTLIAGQRILVHRLTNWAAAWVRAGRRTDLDGVAAILGCILRAVILAGATYGVWWLVRRWPVILWAVVPLWLWAAVRALGTNENEHSEEPPVPAADTDAQREQLHTLIRDLISDRPGVHLSTLLAHLQKHGQGEGWTVSDLKARLPASGVPVRRSVKVQGQVANGVHRDDVPAPSPAEEQQEAA